MSIRKASFITGFFVLVIVSTLLPGARHVLAQDSNSQGTARVNQLKRIAMGAAGRALSRAPSR
jgi:hypothetical protein